MSLVIALVIGGLIGWVASILMRTNAQMGIIANILVGIIGSFLGHWLAGQLGIQESSTLARLLVAIGGAALLILVLRLAGLFR